MRDNLHLSLRLGVRVDSGSLVGKQGLQHLGVTVSGDHRGDQGGRGDHECDHGEGGDHGGDYGVGGDHSGDHGGDYNDLRDGGDPGGDLDGDHCDYRVGGDHGCDHGDYSYHDFRLSGGVHVLAGSFSND